MGLKSQTIFSNGKPISLLINNRNPFRPFSVRSALLSSSWFLESLSSVISSRKRNPNSHFASWNPRNMPNLPHSLRFHYPSFSFSYSSSTNPNASSRISRSNPRQNHNSHLPKVNSDEFMEIIALVERGGDDMELKLNQMNPRLSVTSVSKILNLLNDRGVSALCFFNWVQKNCSDFNPNSEIYNQVINNTGLLEDYESMLVLLTELSLKRHCLTEKAFGFLKVFSYDQVRIGNSVERIVEILNRVKGSCHNSGIYALIKTLCALNSFNLAIFVMEETARKRSYYHVLIAAKCRSGDFQEARDLFDEMKRFGCDPNTKSYNYLLGSLCKKEKIAEACELLEIMENLGYLPDSVTFEVIAFHACRLGRMDAAIEFLYQMMSEGLEPRITTHSAFIKGYFWSGQIQDAHKYVVEMCGKDKHSSNMNYTLLASLFQKSGRVVEAREILVEMIEKGLKPNFPVYMRVVKDLYKMGKGGLIADLKCRYLKFHPITDNR
ncbi:pentatricopeptide repeat-containing protein At1g09900-like [Magnolia sinica]|uniref:pentatricopeptide repeat-containing protein At1g09900-like n=1 Tax=Magnolia sinica TaxID=86752 RepID=UPI0026595296|nr:pentatricopeptide repeat-containing protein At1g09900-like [Magnolia sinica]